MKRKNVFIFAKCAAVLALLVGLFFLLPKTKNCCDAFAPELEKLIIRGHAGDIDAIATLHAKAKKEGIKAEEELWALEGGLRGNETLRRAYVEIFKSEINPERRQRLLATIKASEMPGAPCLLDSLEGSPPHNTACK